MALLTLCGHGVTANPGRTSSLPGARASSILLKNGSILVQERVLSSVEMEDSRNPSTSLALQGCKSLEIVTALSSLFGLL